jgi:6-phosphogluconolactonase
VKIQLLLLALILLSTCKPGEENKKEKNMSHPFYVGTYTSNASNGIYKYQLNNDGTLDSIGLAANSENPSYLTFNHDKKYLLAVNELEEGAVESFEVTDSLKFISKSPSGGTHPCYVSTNKAGYVLAANYSSGNVGLLRLNNNGTLSELLDIQQHKGEGVTARQKAPHAHSSRFDERSNTIISADLGTDELVFSSIDTIKNKLTPNKQYSLKMDAGAGPRHFEFHPYKNWIYVVNELNSTVTIVKKTKSGFYEKIASVSTLPEDFNEVNYSADIHISEDGKFLYASNRGHNSIAVFNVDKNSGLIKLIANTSTHGTWPRNFSLSPNGEFLLVANQNSNNIVSLKRDKSTGLLTFKSEINAPSPVCILFE